MLDLHNHRVVDELEWLHLMMAGNRIPANVTFNTLGWLINLAYYLVHKYSVDTPCAIERENMKKVASPAINFTSHNQVNCTNIY